MTTAVLATRHGMRWRNRSLHLEGGTRGLAFASGIAAISSAFMLLSSGDHIVITEDVYGGTYRFVTEVLTKFGIAHTFVDFTDPEEVAKGDPAEYKIALHRNTFQSTFRHYRYRTDR